MPQNYQTIYSIEGQEDIISTFPKSFSKIREISIYFQNLYIHQSTFSHHQIPRYDQYCIISSVVTTGVNF